MWRRAFGIFCARSRHDDHGDYRHDGHYGGQPSDGDVHFGDGDSGYYRDSDSRQYEKDHHNDEKNNGVYGGIDFRK